MYAQWHTTRIWISSRRFFFFSSTAFQSDRKQSLDYSSMLELYMEEMKRIIRLRNPKMCQQAEVDKNKTKNKQTHNQKQIKTEENKCRCQIKLVEKMKQVCFLCYVSFVVSLFVSHTFAFFLFLFPTVWAESFLMSTRLIVSLFCLE